MIVVVVKMAEVRGPAISRFGAEHQFSGAIIIISGDIRVISIQKISGLGEDAGRARGDLRVGLVGVLGTLLLVGKVISLRGVIHHLHASTNTPVGFL